jgi:hypothetical protein
MPSKRAERAEEITATPTKRLRVDDTSYDSDEEPPTPDNDHLNWRLAPEESHSDWKIQIMSSLDEKAENRIIETYHVHKHMVAVGSKKCEYFSRLFKSSFSESNYATSCIELDSLAADAFTVFLDYMYSPDKDDLKISTTNATALHYLGKYFGNRRLRWLVKQFWSTDIRVETCGTYFAHGKRFHDEKILSAVANFCTSQIDSITPESSILQQADLDLMFNILKSSRPEMSKHLSTLIARFCSDHDDITAESFSQMTNDQVLPVIDCQAAIELMAVENRFVQEKEDRQQLSSLEKRCSEALSLHLGDVDLTSSRSESCMNELNSRVLANVLAAAQREIQIINSENQRLMIENHTQKSENESLKKENQSRKTTNEVFVAQNHTLNSEIRALTDAKHSLLSDIEGLIPVSADGTLGLQDTSCQRPQEVVGLPAFDRNRSLKRSGVYQTTPFTNILGKKEPGRCYPIYYFKKGG